MTKITIGSRGSALALWQARFVKNLLEKPSPDSSIEIQIIRTTGDKMTEVALAKIGGKGVFVKEIEEALLDERIDLAVHSLKDVPTDLPKGLELSAILRREDPRDCLVGRASFPHLGEVSDGSRIGTGSLRRTVQLKHFRPDLEIVAIRGNVDTRLRKLKEIPLDGIVLAKAGLDRLGLSERIAFPFAVTEMTPAIGQGALAIETRVGDSRVGRILRTLEHEETRLCVEAERIFLQRMGGGCQVPMGAHAYLDQGAGVFTAVVASSEGRQLIRKTIDGPPADLPELAVEASRYLLANGAREILDHLEL